MRRFLCTLITVSLIFTIVFAQVSFSVTGDIRNAENAERLSKIGIFKGDSAGFGLERQLTRAEAAALIVRLIGKEKEVLNGNYSHPFSDVQSWADKYVGYLYTNKLTTGISSTLYGSSEYVSLQQFVTFILRVLGYSDQKGDFKYSQCLEKAVQIGLLNNEEVYYYTSKDSFIRDDIVGIIVNALSTNVKDSGTTLLEKLVYEGAIDMEAAAGAGFISLEPVTIKDPNLEAKIREIIGKKEGELFAYELEKIESIDARNSGISSLDGLQYCKNLKKLYITDNKITDLEPLSGLVHLTALLAARNEIKNIDTLSNLTDLQFLDLSVNKINIIKPLESLANLETLGIGNNPIVDITPVSSLRNLEQLSLNGLNLSDLKLVENLDKLTWIYAGANEIIDISHLAKLENLSYLDLTFNKVSDISVLKKLKNLKVLKVSNNSINDISSISELVNLEELDLSDNNISDIAALKGLVNLKSLFLSNNPIANYMPIKDIYGQLETKDFNVVFP